MRDQPQSDGRIFIFFGVITDIYDRRLGPVPQRGFSSRFQWIKWKWMKMRRNFWNAEASGELLKPAPRFVFFPYFSSVLVTCRVSPRVNDELADVSSTYGQMKVVSDQLEGPSLVVSVHGHCGGGRTGPSHVIFTADNRISSCSFLCAAVGPVGKKCGTEQSGKFLRFRVRNVGESVNLNELNRTRQLFFKKFWLRCGQ